MDRNSSCREPTAFPLFVSAPASTKSVPAAARAKATSTSTVVSTTSSSSCVPSDRFAPRKTSGALAPIARARFSANKPQTNANASLAARSPRASRRLTRLDRNAVCAGNTTASACAGVPGARASASASEARRARNVPVTIVHATPTPMMPLRGTSTRFSPAARRSVNPTIVATNKHAKPACAVRAEAVARRRSSACAGWRAPNSEATSIAPRGRKPARDEVVGEGRRGRSRRSSRKLRIVRDEFFCISG